MISVNILFAAFIVFLFIGVISGHFADQASDCKANSIFEGISTSCLVLLVLFIIAWILTTSSLILTETTYTKTKQIELSSIYDIELLDKEESLIRIRDGVNISEYKTKDCVIKFQSSDTVGFEIGTTKEYYKCWIFYNTIDINTYTIYLPEEYIPTIE